MEARLALRYDFSSDDDFGWLEANLSTAKISGRMGFWVQWQDVKEWASELTAFPMRSNYQSEADWGQSESDGSNYQPIIKIVISASQLGKLDVAVKLADHLDERVGCRGTFSTDFPALQRFAEDLGALMNRQRDEAVLTGVSDP